MPAPEPPEPGTPAEVSIRPDVLELLISYDPRRSLYPTHLVHSNGMPYTPSENRKFASATEEERELADQFMAAQNDHDLARYRACTALIRIGKAASVPDDDARAYRAATTGPGPNADLTVNQLTALAAEADDAVLTAFRAHILPHLTGTLRAEALDHLDHLDKLHPGSNSPEDETLLHDYRRSQLQDLEYLLDLSNRYGDGHLSLTQCWDRIPEAERTRAREILARFGEEIPET